MNLPPYSSNEATPPGEAVIATDAPEAPCDPGPVRTPLADPTATDQCVRFSRMALLALAYAALSFTTKALALPSGYATPPWPAAGLAVGGLMIWGWRYWPAIFAGSFANNFFLSLGVNVGGQRATGAGIAGVIAAGASLQAVAAGFLARRFLDSAMPLTTVSDTLRFLVTGGPMPAGRGRAGKGISLQLEEKSREFTEKDNEPYTKAKPGHHPAMPVLRA